MPQPGFKYLDSDLQPGHEVLPKDDHFPNLSAEKQKAEAVIRAGDPRGRQRAHAVFVFERRKIAEGLLDETDGKHLYELSVEPQDILSRSDLRIYDEIVEALRGGRNAGGLIEEFWAGIERPDPRIELTVAKARVRRKLVDDGDK